MENKLKFVKTTVYVIKGLQCNLLGLKELMKLDYLRLKIIRVELNVTTMDIGLRTVLKR